MTQGSIGTSGYVRLYNNSAYNKDYYERNKARLARLRIKRKLQKKRNEEFVLLQNKKTKI